MIIIILGITGSGKDTAAKILAEKFRDCTIIKNSQPMKNMFEYGYALEKGSLNEPGTKSEIPINYDGTKTTDKTYHDLMVEYFKKLAKVDPMLMINISYRKGILAHGKKHVAIFNDVRSVKELLMVDYLAKETNQAVSIIHLTGRGEAKDSDKELPEVLQKCGFSPNYQHVDNSYSHAQLKENLLRIFSYSSIDK